VSLARPLRRARRPARPWLAGLLGVALAAASPALWPAAAAPGGGAAPGPRQAIPITVTRAALRTVEVWEHSVGQVEAENAPAVAAEVPGRVLAVHAEVGAAVAAGDPLAEIEARDFRLAIAAARADIRRIEALARAGELRVRRLRELVARESSSQAALDDAEAQLAALRAERAAARVRLQRGELDLARTRVVSPTAGRIDQRYVSPGDYVKVGTPLFRITDTAALRVRLPFPESLAGRLRRGLPVRLESPVAPGRVVEAEITDLRPRITRASRAIEVIVRLANPGDWEPGASVSGAVRVARRPAAVLVPETSVVRRPAGTVVYAIEGATARARVVETGLRLAGEVEIRSGLAAGTTVAVDGAGFLSDGVAVEVKGR